jgi:hypothetical protein
MRIFSRKIRSTVVASVYTKPENAIDKSLPFTADELVIGDFGGIAKRRRHAPLSAGTVRLVLIHSSDLCIPQCCLGACAMQIHAMIGGIVAWSDPIHQDRGQKATVCKDSHAGVRFAATLKQSVNSINEFNFFLSSIDLMLKEIGAQDGGNRVPVKTRVIHLEEHAGDVASSDSKQITEPLSVPAQANAEAAFLTAQESFHLQPFIHLGTLKADLTEQVDRLITVFEAELWLKSDFELGLGAASIIAKISASVRSKAAQGLIEGVAQHQPVFAANAAHM